MRRIIILAAAWALCGLAEAAAQPAAAAATVQAAEIEVVDADTFDARGVRYRLAEVNGPDRGGSGSCLAERRLGDLARAEVRAWMRNRGAVTFLPTGEIQAADGRYRVPRVVARVQARGEDLGRYLVRRGLALQPGQRRITWCGGIPAPD
jgi:endonuclease YncB( thermonuclease family)